MTNDKIKKRYETPYTLEYTRNNIKVLKDGKIASQGFIEESSALQSVWALENMISDHIYEVEDAKVFLVQFEKDD